MLPVNVYKHGALTLKNQPAGAGRLDTCYANKKSGVSVSVHDTGHYNRQKDRRVPQVGPVGFTRAEPMPLNLNYGSSDSMLFVFVALQGRRSGFIPAWGNAPGFWMQPLHRAESPFHTNQEAHFPLDYGPGLQP